MLPRGQFHANGLFLIQLLLPKHSPSNCFDDYSDFDTDCDSKKVIPTNSANLDAANDRVYAFCLLGSL